MANISLLPGNQWSYFHNQALLAYSEGISFAINYENRYSLKELGTCSFSASWNTGSAALGILYSNFGYADFRRIMRGLACALPLSDKVSAGVQIDWFSEKIYGEYNDSQTVTFEAGIIMNPSDAVTIGIHLFNPVPDRIRKNEMASVLRAGAGLKVSPALFTGAEFELSTGGRKEFRAGLEYDIVKGLKVRGGFRSAGSSFSFGIGYSMRPATVDLSFCSHQNLGISSSLSVSFNIGR